MLLLPPVTLHLLHRPLEPVDALLLPPVTSVTSLATVSTCAMLMEGQGLPQGV